MPLTEAQSQAGGHNSTTPDRCASDNFAQRDPGAAHSGQPDRCAQIIELFENAVGKPKDDWRVQEANRRLQIIQTFDELLAQGKSMAQAAKIIGEAYTSIWRYRKYYAKDGFNGLLPDTAACGRKSWLEKLGLTPDELAYLLKRCPGINLDMESITGAARAFANSDECPPRLAEVILNPNRRSKHAIPESIRDVFKVSAPAQDAHRGPRRLSLKGFYIPRKMDITAGDVFVSDDTTPIYGWYIPWRQCEEYPFGVKLLQGQFIPVLDVASQYPVSGVYVGREKASYRAADIWHLFGHTFDEVGLPRLGFQLERGSWEANIIRGQEVSYAVDEVSYSRRVGGLRQLPCNPHDRTPEGFTWPKTLQTFTSFLPKSKSIEAFFNRMQSLEGTLWGSLGRDQMRKPFEKMKRIFQACQRGAEDPRKYFLSHTELAARITGILEYVANEPMEGEVFKGIPRVNWQASIAERPLFQFKGIPELEELRWLYRRDWSVVTITNGWARLRLTHPISGERYSLFYTNPSVFAQHEGEQVAVYYDREKFEDAAQIILAKTGEYLCEAQYVERVGSFLGTDKTGHEAAKEWRNAVMSTYVTIAKHAPSRQLPPEIAQRRIELKNQVTAPSVVDGRPAAAAPQPVRSAFSPASPEQLTKQQNRISRQAALAARLSTLGGDE